MGKILKLNWYAFIFFLLGEIAAGAYLTINHGWIPVVIFSIPCVIVLPFLAESFALLIVGSISAIFLFLFLLFLIDQATLSFAYDDISVFVDVIINIGWGFAFIFVSIGWYQIVKKVSKKVQYVIEIQQYRAEEKRRKQEKEAKRKQEAEAKAKAEEERRRQEKEAKRKQEAEAKAKAEEERRRQEAERAKVEEERIRQKQPEYCNYCKELINNFWNNDFFDSDEETDVLLSRLRFTLENSKYFNWKTEFYDKVVEKIKATTRPPKSARSQQQSRATSLNSSGFNMYFNGILLTLEQYQILIHYPQVKDLYNEDLFAFCCMLAKKTPEFANFKQTVSDEVQEACNFMGVNYEDLSEDSVKKAYRRLYLQYLPDWNKSANAAEMFSKLQKSNEILLKELQLKRLKIY